MRPLIAVTGSWDEKEGRLWLGKMYIEAVTSGGGIPLPLAYNGDEESLQGILRVISGLVLSGGPDVDPMFFGEDPIPAGGEICPERDIFEINLTKLALASNIPVLGICRGMQVLNIAAGGDIYQDLDRRPCNRQIKHFQQAPRWYPTHKIVIDSKTLLASVLGSGEVRVNSYHHQAIRNVAPGFKVSARSADGVIEAVEMPASRFTLGVQCHPETMWKRYPIFCELFRRLAEAGKETLNFRKITD